MVLYKENCYIAITEHKICLYGTNNFEKIIRPEDRLNEELLEDLFVTVGVVDTDSGMIIRQRINAL